VGIFLCGRNFQFACPYMQGYTDAQNINIWGREGVKSTNGRHAMNDKLAFSIAEFCVAVGISRRHLYTLWERNQGPPRAKAGDRVIIPTEGAEKWLRELEAA